MLVIEICLHPFGDADKCQIIEKMTIHNTGENESRSEYDDYIFKYKDKKIKFSDYKRDDGALKLLYKCLEQYFEIDIKGKFCGYNCMFFDRSNGECDKYEIALGLLKSSETQWDYARCDKCIEENDK